MVKIVNYSLIMLYHDDVNYSTYSQFYSICVVTKSQSSEIPKVT